MTPNPSERPEVEPLSAAELAAIRQIVACGIMPGEFISDLRDALAQRDRMVAVEAERDALSAEVARLEKAAAFNRGIYATLEAERDDIERSYLATCQRLDDSEVEVARLRGIVARLTELADDAVCTCEDECFDARFDANVRARYGAPATPLSECPKGRLRSALHPVSEEGPCQRHPILSDPTCPACMVESWSEVVSEEGPPAAPEAPTGPVLGVCDFFLTGTDPHKRIASCINWRPAAPEGTEREG